jgi:hypothetical protein
MKIGALVFLTEQSGNPGAIAREVENLGFESHQAAVRTDTGLLVEFRTPPLFDCEGIRTLSAHAAQIPSVS